MTIQQTDERNFRPRALADFIGQAEVKKTLRLMLDAAQKRGSVLEHVIFFGPPGLGKTTLAAIIAAEMNGRLFELSASSVKKAGDLASVLAKVQRNDVVFLDEIHALGRDVAEILYSAMEDFVLNIIVESEKPPVQLHMPPFTLVGATTDFGMLPEPMRARFGQSFHLQIYTLDELRQVVGRAADTLGYMYDDDGLEGIARRARGTPRVALRLFRRCVDAAINASQDWLDAALVETTMPVLGLDKRGLDDADRKYLGTLVHVYRGGPVGPRSIAASANLDLATVETVIEPALLQMSLIARTPRGRRITREGYAHVCTFLASAPAINWARVEAADASVPAPSPAS
ncbi:MAG: Holliday junction branch migration DNA helicase RuvB [Anaerolineales bacterium]